MAQANVQDRDYYTVPEAARELDVSPSTVWRWIEAKKLPAHRVGARKIRIRKDDLRAVVAPARAEEAAERANERYVFDPPTEEELARRHESVARILESQKGRSIAPLTTSGLIGEARQEREERYRSWMGLDSLEMGDPKVVEVVAESDLARLLDETNGMPLVLIKDGVCYRLERELPDAPLSRRDPGSSYDSERLMAGIRAAAGTISEEEAERRIADIYRWREEGSRPSERP